MKHSTKLRAFIMLVIFAGIATVIWPATGQLARYIMRPGDIGDAAIVADAIIIPSLGISIIFAGLALYVLSRSFRFAFGLLEIGVGIGTVMYTFKTSILNMDFPGPDTSSTDKSLLSNVVQIAIALYFFVQGLEDTSSRLRPDTWARKSWDKLFPTA